MHERIVASVGEFVCTTICQPQSHVPSFFQHRFYFYLCLIRNLENNSEEDSNFTVYSIFSGVLFVCLLVICLFLSCIGLLLDSKFQWYSDLSPVFGFIFSSVSAQFEEALIQFDMW